MKHTIQNLFRLVILSPTVLVLFSCNDEVKERKSKTDIDISIACFGTLMVSDSVDIFMKYVDKDNKDIIDAHVIKRVALTDREMKLNVRLKDSDKWKIDKVTTESGTLLCHAYDCADSVKMCFSTEKLPDFQPVDSVQHIVIKCRCL